MKTYLGKMAEIQLKYKTGDFYKCKIRQSRDAYEVLLKFYDQDTIELTETAIILYLNSANNTIGWFKASSGGMHHAIIDKRIILATALKCGAAGIIISHNHPSGQLLPSEADNVTTKNLKEACLILDIQLIEHLIVTPEGYYSYADEGKI